MTTWTKEEDKAFIKKNSDKDTTLWDNPAQLKLFKQYVDGFNTVMEYFDEISEESRVELDEKLEKLGL
jgi:hypothetical protein|tara:strand:+ start:2053 stop:2256 length:204 start_codon:yes stop_codon:yes gene_type:complete